MTIHHTSSHDSSVHAVDNDYNGDPVFELARLRARRAARLSQEHVAGQRRMVVCMVTAIFFVTCVLLCATNILSWALLVLPAGLFAAAMYASRMAAVRAKRVGESEEKRMRELFQHSEKLTRMYAADKLTNTQMAQSLREDDLPERTDTVSSENSGHVRDEKAAVIEDSVLAAAAADDIHTSTERQQDMVADGDSYASTQGTWDVHYAPASRYADRSRVTGRAVHVDTDLLGIPLISEGASVPARPQKVSTDQRLRSTQQVVADTPVVFDLDEVLEMRRNAQ